MAEIDHDRQDDSGGFRVVPDAWSNSRECSQESLRSGRRWVWPILLTFGALMWFAIPHGIGFSWRECDTQAIARNFLTDGFDPLRPRVDWRGDSDGAVECEFPLYSLAIASVLQLACDHEWPGRLIALLATMMAGLFLHRLLEMRSGAGAAIAGLVTFLTAGSTVMLATRVMPDALSLVFAIASLAPFVRYLVLGRVAWLLLSMVALTLAAVQKPLALQVGWIMFGWGLVLAPVRLRDWRLWAAFVAVLLTVAAWLVHGQHLYSETSLTFGVVSGGDTKFPGAQHLLQPGLYKDLLLTTFLFGMSGLGLVSAGSLLICRRVDRSDVVVLASVGVALLLSMRYSHSESLGPHYHVFAALAGSWCVARTWGVLRGRWWIAVFALCIAAQASWRIGVEHGARSAFVGDQSMEIASEVARLSKPGELLVVRSGKTHTE